MLEGRDFEIRPEVPEDAASIREVNRLAFGGDVESSLVEKIQQSPEFIPGLSLVAVRQAHILGHILFSRIKIMIEDDPGRSIPALALAPMAVHPDVQNQGIGSVLVRRGLEACRKLGHRVVVVIGHPDYYPRFGFTSARARGLEAPFPVPDEAFLAVELEPGSLSGMSGRVVYPPAFEEAT
jgi:putative acetyltransferase